MTARSHKNINFRENYDSSFTDNIFQKISVAVTNVIQTVLQRKILKTQTKNMQNKVKKKIFL